MRQENEPEKNQSHTSQKKMAGGWAFQKTVAGDWAFQERNGWFSVVVAIENATTTRVVTTAGDYGGAEFHWKCFDLIDDS